MLLDDFELERVDGGEECGVGWGVVGVEGLDDVFLEELFEVGVVFFGVVGVGIGDVCENFGWKVWDFVEVDVVVVGECVVDVEFVVVDEVDDVVWLGFVDSFVVVVEEFV